MSSRVLLICHGSTSATRRTAFPLDEPLEASAHAGAQSLRARLDGDPRWADKPVITSPALRCRQTAAALGRAPGGTDDGPTDWDLGDWAGAQLEHLAETVPADVEAWLTLPWAAPHGGEPLTGLLERVGAWLDGGPSQRPDRFLAITHPAVLRAAVVHALGAAPLSFWRIDAAPLAVVELHGRPGRWTVSLRGLTPA